MLLERSRAGTYRVQAFRTAATVVAGMPPTELSSRLAAGTLGELPGLGPATVGVVTQAADGELPAYLASLQEQAAVSLAPGGEGLYLSLIHI